ncbi:MAG TPA: nucleoside triphosphate pyrophosphohydrolase, partial [Actinomycetota bacterium]|nr:nucleoside triphosphate pyrophosphohydrolase [Actinomycetota bacterium]
ERELGDLLFALVMLARHLEVDAESALRKAAQRFAERFRKVEVAARARDIALDAMSGAELNQLWEEAKTS